MPFDPDKSYNDLSLLPPKAELETKAILRKATAANKALAELKGAAIHSESRRFDQCDSLQEARLSSEIVGRVSGRMRSARHAYVRETNIF